MGDEKRLIASGWAYAAFGLLLVGSLSLAIGAVVGPTAVIWLGVILDLGAVVVLIAGAERARRHSSQ